jgi:TetR/AcrR family transcriptional repressor of nem operon
MAVDADLDGPVRRGCLAQNTVEELGGRDEEATRAVRRMEDGMIDAFAARIEQGQRDGDIAPGVDARVQALFLQNAMSGLRVMAKTFDRPALYQIIDTTLTAL